MVCDLPIQIFDVPYIPSRRSSRVFLCLADRRVHFSCMNSEFRKDVVNLFQELIFEILKVLVTKFRRLSQTILHTSDTLNTISLKMMLSKDSDSFETHV